MTPDATRWRSSAYYDHVEGSSASDIAWGVNDPSFIAAGAEAYRRDLPDAEIHKLDAGRFVMDEKKTNWPD